MVGLPPGNHFPCCVFPGIHGSLLFSLEMAGIVGSAP